MFWVISVYFNIRNTLPQSGTFLLGHLVYTHTHTLVHRLNCCKTYLSSTLSFRSNVTLRNLLLCTRMLCIATASAKVGNQGVTFHSQLLYILLRVIVCIYTDRLLVHLHPALISMSNAGMVRGGGLLTPGPHYANHRDGIIDTFQLRTGQICRVRMWRDRPGCFRNDGKYYQL